MKKKGIGILVNNKRVARLKPGITLKAYQEKHPDRTVERINGRWPSMADLEEWHNEGGCLTPICECWTEPDGACSHGRPSWLLALGFI